MKWNFLHGLFPVFSFVMHEEEWSPIQRRLYDFINIMFSVLIQWVPAYKRKGELQYRKVGPLIAFLNHSASCFSRSDLPSFLEIYRKQIWLVWNTRKATLLLRKKSPFLKDPVAALEKFILPLLRSLEGW